MTAVVRKLRTTAVVRKLRTTAVVRKLRTTAVGPPGTAIAAADPAEEHEPK